jgi:hypothetical protein
MMRTARLYRYGDRSYWTGNYAEGGEDLMKAAVQSAETANKPTYHIKPASLTAERRADVDRSFEGYVRLNSKYGYRSGEQAYRGDRPAVMKEFKKTKSTLFRRIRNFFVEEVEE